MDLKSFFDKHNPWARQSIAARMLEADRKQYWKAPEDIKKELAKIYAMSVIQKGVACCEHTCNNPMLQKFVTNIISLYGLLTPKELEQFKTVIAKAVGKTQAEHEALHQQVRNSLKNAMEKNKQEENVTAQENKKQMEGFEMVEEKMEETKVSSSGSSWMIMVIVITILGLVALGWKRKKI
jgi:cobaltochelatase CobN